MSMMDRMKSQIVTLSAQNKCLEAELVRVKNLLAVHLDCHLTAERNETQTIREEIGQKVVAIDVTASNGAQMAVLVPGYDQNVQAVRTVQPSENIVQVTHSLTQASSNVASDEVINVDVAFDEPSRKAAKVIAPKLMAKNFSKQ